MNLQLSNFDIYPRIVKENTLTRMTIKPLGAHVAFDQAKKYVVHILPTTETDTLMVNPSTSQYEVNVTGEGVIEFEHCFQGEQEHYVRLYDEHTTIERDTRITQLSVYSLAPDLFDKRPYKGDLHIHTHHSDGKESPAIAASYYRKAGYDFISITDHHQYHPSIEAIQAFESVPIDLTLLPGEEVHCLNNDIHIVGIGGEYSVNELKNNQETFIKEVREIMEASKIADGINKFVFACCIWVVERIREAGGLAIFAHPHWIENVYHVADKFTYEIFKHNVCDAFELLGGQPLHENEMQVAMYHELRAKGYDIPVVGSSDSHGCLAYNGYTHFDKLKTIVFSKSCVKDDLINAIKEGNSVAVDDYSNKQYRVHGTYRLVSYARFLMENYFPIHDELCFEEGMQMKEYLTGSPDSIEMLKRLKGRTRKYMDHCFGENGCI